MPRVTKLISGLVALGTAALLVSEAQASLLYDANVTSNAIFGSGNANGSFTVDRSNNVELGLRGKLRHNASGQAENTFNSNGDGTYTFAAGVAPTQSAPTAVWSFEWSINTDLSGTSGRTLDDLTYTLGIDYNPTQGTTFNTFDPIFTAHPTNAGGYWDHSMGTNATGQGAGVEAGDIGTYLTNLSIYNLAQNSWKAHWYMPPGMFDPTVNGTYDFYLAASDGNGELARTSIQVIVGTGGAAVPDGGSVLLLLAPALIALGARRRFLK
jgi:hypothetical protein